MKARAALIAGSSHCEASARLIHDLDDCTAALATAIWYERVPSNSNISNLLSRGDVPIALDGFPASLEDLVSSEVSDRIMAKLL